MGGGKCLKRLFEKIIGGGEVERNLDLDPATFFTGTGSVNSVEKLRPLTLTY